MNHELAVLGKIFQMVFDFLDTDINLFGFMISPLDIAITNLVIVMLFDILLTYAGYERTE